MKRRINNVFLYHQSAYNTVEKQAAALLQTFLIALPAEHAAKFFQPFFLPGLAGALFCGTMPYKSKNGRKRQGSTPDQAASNRKGTS
ncbi:hypothetical protein [Gemmiger qucibialis]|uniref:hypothetical protein n=1 Tax=Gemmiger qucibialis TaxID=2997294 RepID=UPI0022E0B0D2|nr:hypothetical protein [Gemmiger qucibialis]